MNFGGTVEQLVADLVEAVFAAVSRRRLGRLTETASLRAGTNGHRLDASRPGLPVSTTHVLSSGVAGTMAANRSGLQLATVRNLLLAWVLTLPASILLSATLFWAFSRFG